MRNRSLLLLAVFIMYSATLVEAKSEKESPATSQTAAQKKQAEYLKRVEEKKTEINGSQWDVKVKSQTQGEKDSTDVLTFQNGQISSKNLGKRGFSATNYTITIPEGDQPAIWETMQTGKEGIAFIRGEWLKDSMQGTISEQLEGGKVLKDYYFTTAKRASISPTSSKDESAGSAPKAAAPVKAAKALASLETPSKSTASAAKK